MAGLLDYASSVAGEAKKNVQGLLADPKQALMDILNNLTARAAASQAKTKAAWATRDPKVMAQNALDSSQTALGFAPLGESVNDALVCDRSHNLATCCKITLLGGGDQLFSKRT